MGQRDRIKINLAGKRSSLAALPQYARFVYCALDPTRAVLVAITTQAVGKHAHAMVLAALLGGPLGASAGILVRTGGSTCVSLGTAGVPVATQI